MSERFPAFEVFEAQERDMEARQPQGITLSALQTAIANARQSIAEFDAAWRCLHPPGQIGAVRTEDEREEHLESEWVQLAFEAVLLRSSTPSPEPLPQQWRPARPSAAKATREVADGQGNEVRRTLSKKSELRLFLELLQCYAALWAGLVFLRLCHPCSPVKGGQAARAKDTEQRVVSAAELHRVLGVLLCAPTECTGNALLAVEDVNLAQAVSGADGPSLPQPRASDSRSMYRAQQRGATGEKVAERRWQAVRQLHRGLTRPGSVGPTEKQVCHWAVHKSVLNIRAEWNASQQKQRTSLAATALHYSKQLAAGGGRPLPPALPRSLSRFSAENDTVDKIRRRTQNTKNRLTVVQDLRGQFENVSPGRSIDAGRDAGDRSAYTCRSHSHAHWEFSVPGKAARNSLFARMDTNGNGKLSLAEVDKAVVELWPHFNHKRALMSAYKAADCDDTGYVERREFKKLLHFIIYFTRLWDEFEQIDRDKDDRLTLSEFIAGSSAVGHSMSRAEAHHEFDSMDVNHGGVVLFDEFVAWCAHREQRSQTLETGVLKVADRLRPTGAANASNVFLFDGQTHVF